MILLVDAGNSRVKWSLRHPFGTAAGGGEIARGVLPVGRIAEPQADPRTRSAAPRAEHGSDFVGLAVVSCVAGAEVRAALAATLDRPGTRTHWLTAPASGHGVRNGYRQPGQLGSDRWALLVACQRQGLSPCVAVGAGTALTMDALDGDGQHLGGIILPGFTLMGEALARGTAGARDRDGVPRDFPDNTADGVATGLVLAASGAAANLRARVAARLGRSVGLVITGGDAERLGREFEGDPGVRVRQDLVLEGLGWIARDLTQPAMPAGG